jgi:YVTN family beta-propeller protein
MKTLTAMLILCATTAIAAESIVLKATVSLPGVKGRFDHFAVDTNAHRVFVAALGNNTLEVIDVTAAKRLHTITGLHKPTGVAFIPDANRIVVANGDDGTVKVFDGTNYQLVKNIPGFDDADNVRLDAKANRIYVGYGDGALAAIDAQKWEQISTIKLKAHPESFQLEQNGRRIFVNVPDAKHIAVVDRDQRAVIATWPMEKFRANFPMALDETNHRLFVGCRQPARVVVIDTQTGKPLADFGISGDTDDLFWDPARKQIYVSCGAGFLDVFSDAGGTFTGIGQLASRGGARTSYFAPQFSQIYVAVPERGGAPAELRIYSAQ